MRGYVIAGFLIWLVATILLRFVGQFLFATPLISLLTFLGTGAVLVFALLLLFSRTHLDQKQKLQTALSLALPGMVLDIFSVTFVANVFPNIPPTAHAAFAGYLLWAYSLVLLTALVPLSNTPALAQE